MDVSTVAKQMVGFQKTLFNNTFNAMVIVQDQTENMLNGFLGQVPWITDDARKQMNESMAFAKKARDDFKKAVDDGYSKFDQMFEQK
ncbi:conserved hypothetical protein [Desulfamplus magnetovallimortis]|uniref:Phasin domain-containing protein n=1 Tax=Desulfamplus magnetovallimortis TaxID=1246637 RepID=A0A1W1H6R3_9BACT|nr:hypothetical protein [Desulfamplus magnetovallimortis]SLM28162.1 conserved hypothetical protein [Desulfamplus magnetovallimortis]